MTQHNPNESAKALQKAAAKALKNERKDLKPGGLRTWWSDRSRFQQWLVLLIPVALAFLLPVINPPLITTEPGNDFAITCFTMAVYALVALGLNVVVGMAGLLDMGYIGFFAVGSYVAALWTSSDSTLIHIPYMASLPLAMVVTMVFGIALGIPTLRLRGDYLAIVTLGFGEIIRILATILPPLKGQSGFQNLGAPPGEIGGKPIFFSTNGLPWYWLVLVIIIIVTILLGNLERSRVGRAWIAIREDEDAAETMGVATFKFKLASFATGAALGGLSGALMAGQIGFVNNQKFDVQTSVLYLAAVVLGGQGSKLGAIVGGAIVAYLPMRFTAIADYKFLIFGIVLVVLMLFRPQGLISIRAKLLTYASRVRRFVRKEQDGTPSEAAKRSHLDEQGEGA